MQKLMLKAFLLAISVTLALSNGLAQDGGTQTKAAAPSAEQLASARKQVRDLYAADLKLAKTPAQIWSLATKMSETAAGTKNDAESAYAIALEAIDLYVTVGDWLSAFRLVDHIATKVDINATGKKFELYKRAAKATQTTPLKKVLATIGLKLASDAANAEDYVAAKEVATLVTELAKPTGDQVLVERAKGQLQRFTDLSKTWQQVVENRQKLLKNENDAEANEVVGRYLCFTRQDWGDGLPRLAKSGDAELKAIATYDLATLKTADSMAATADAWWKLTESQSESEKKEVLPRVAYWYEQALPSLTGLTKVTAEKRLEAAYTALSGRDFKTLISGVPNGLRSSGIFDCAPKAHVAKIGPSFDFKKSWLISLEFQSSDLAAGPHMVFFWGDNRAGHDPLYLNQEGLAVICHVEDSVGERVQGIVGDLSKDHVGKWVNVKLVHDVISQEFELYIDHRLLKREPLTISPRVDKKMDAVVGSITNGTEQRFTGKVRDVWLGNIK